MSPLASCVIFSLFPGNICRPLRRLLRRLIITRPSLLTCGIHRADFTHFFPYWSKKIAIFLGWSLCDLLTSIPVTTLIVKNPTNNWKSTAALSVSENLTWESVTYMGSEHCHGESNADKEAWCHRQTEGKISRRLWYYFRAACTILQRSQMQFPSIAYTELALVTCIQSVAVAALYELWCYGCVCDQLIDCFQ